eukprot:CAMPEP_0202349436 /NCGR_PEP_ID=MMETSP1126-20121109/6933_1 /ASSEMBLY_ACC=CAM_ASM_000457 /TAXON_ID=3047 /ORGANISM="Dunaliella tertiolecta, Strain CCMP1320" /LENGTH=288 /DNA_ID=CAMNT_0048941255 /DNA_START=162 /DNA_END=1025 /DNA_ORIENTATION=+
MQAYVNDRVMRFMGSGRVFKDNQARINSMDFHRTEDMLVTASDDDSIHVYNTASGMLTETVYSKKYGVSNICSTHSQYCVMYATRKPPANSNDLSWYSLRYHDIRRNEYVRYFRGHTGPLNTLAMSPKNDIFMSASQDKTVRLWDMRTNLCQGLMQAPGNPCASFDQQGLVFAVAATAGVIKLYDVRSYDKGPFDTFNVTEESNTPVPFSGLRFSNDGKWMLGMMEGRVYVMDAFNGTVVRRFQTGSQEGAMSMEAAFSPDSQYVLSGCENSSIKVWHLMNGNEVAEW